MKLNFTCACPEEVITSVCHFKGAKATAVADSRWSTGVRKTTSVELRHIFPCIRKHYLSYTYPCVLCFKLFSQSPLHWSRRAEKVSLCVYRKMRLRKTIFMFKSEQSL